ncbi:amyloid beta precursor protein-binding protein 1 [Cavenderia fasciculata]|uniref:NEDD8-activating enzyme E1 regulatory subunit n=1 Tax=Cavenderia fasciculata TaxID=261658 RepID=F4QAY9_CACFS|nr:amyloid beta precursor protein-binding protein 1 [Cavenderia fasciculata]EGG14761.1 amyloid beta precursor protein-binding protein 1 [Cavenderia fasciculata]|eukprot:XP_004351277.1 amyloid beta precursor protein-binding protein 1 [Cavenderia fasciculata]
MTDTEKYDRQLRLWGEDGQAKLEKSHICLINGTATGTETLKNLVLPGIGAFTVVDGNKVGASDLGNNFFLDTTCLGHSRALKVSEYLRELNDRVKGSSCEEDPVALISDKITFFKDFDLVIANKLPEQSLITLAAYLYENNIPLLIVNSYGYIGYLRIVTPEHQIIESKPDTPLDDLRIYNPWKELEVESDNVDLSNMNAQQHSHVPYILLLVKFLKEWRNEKNNGKMPETRAEKDEFKKFFISKSHNSDEENFNEGVKGLFKYLQPPRVPSEVEAILNDPKTSNINQQSDDFWVLAAALKQFVDQHKVLPLPGNIPDLTSDTITYVTLQKLYHDKANADLEDFNTKVESIVSNTNRQPIPSDSIKKFAKNSRFINIIRYRSLNDEYTIPNTSVIQSEIEMDNNSNVNFYLVLRAVEKFNQTHNRYPGASDEDVDSDVPLLKSILATILSEISISSTIVKDDYITEIIRYGNSELHNIASLMGGITSQEVIKLITHQYVPLNNTFIFNGINSTATPFKL